MNETYKNHRDKCHQILLLIDQVGKATKDEVRVTTGFTKKLTDEIMEHLDDTGMIGGSWEKIGGEWIRYFQVVGIATRDFIDAVHKYNSSKQTSKPYPKDEDWEEGITN